MSSGEKNKDLIRRFIDTVWVAGALGRLPEFWTADCVNHAMPGPDKVGLAVLRAYHEPFLAAFSDLQVGIVQQIAEDDRVVTQMTSSARHTGPFFGLPASQKTVSLDAIRIDRLRDGKIAEHWSVADVAGLLRQMQPSPSQQG